MAAAVGFLARLRAVLVPTAGQAIGSVIAAVLLLALAQSDAVLRRLGITPAALDATRAQFHARFDVILHSTPASQLALVTFWATIGLIAYLVCWGAYNMFIEARNELTLTTAYTNRTDPSPAHWRSAAETLALKAVAGLGLAIILSTLWYGASFWLALSAGVLQQPSAITALQALGSIFGLAAHLYLGLAFAQLTFTPWYRPAP